MQYLRIRFCPFSPTHEPNNLCRSTEIANVFHPALIKPTLRICMHLQKTIFSINKLCTLNSVILPTIRFCDNKKSAVTQLVDFFFRNFYAPDPCLLSQDRALQMKLPLGPSSACWDREMTPSILLGNHTPFGISRIYYLDEISSIVPWKKEHLGK